MSGLDFSFWLCASSSAHPPCSPCGKSSPSSAISPIHHLRPGVWMTSFSLEETALAPALRSYWLDSYVSTAIISYTLFLFSFLFSVMLLVGGKKKYKSLPETDVLNEWAYRACIIGLALLTIVIITGAVWAEYAWGSFWSWDPKETGHSSPGSSTPSICTSACADGVKQRSRGSTSSVSSQCCSPSSASATCCRDCIATFN